MSSSQYLLPLFSTRKQTKNALNEKNLIVLLLLSTIVSLFFILKNLPSNVNFNNENNLRLFLPKINKSKNIFHDEQAHQHQFIIPPPPDLEKDNHKIRNENKEEKPIPVVPKVDDTNTIRRNKVKEMTLLAWNSYKKYAWGKNELKPLSKTGHQAGIFGNAQNLGASIVDALDTLYIMGLKDEYKDGRDWVEKHFSLNVDAELSAFEVNIRFVGGFLAIYTLTNDKMFLDKADEVANLLLPVFNSHTGIPYSLVNPMTKTIRNYNWAAGSCSILAEIGTISLEFEYLSEKTGKKIYKEKSDKIYSALNNVKKDDNMYYNYINPNSGDWCGRQAGIGGLADSFYEYLLKLYLYKNKSDKSLLDMYLKAMESVERHIIGKSSSGFVFTGEYSNGGLTNKMGHLACFSGGLFALTSMYIDELDSGKKTRYENLAKDITNTCHESYIRTTTHLGPEAFSLDNGNEVQALDRYYILRPEVVESYFYLWRMTKDNKYRDWAWDAVEALEKYCRTENGYTGIKDVNSNNPPKDDVQQSFFFAETLKYLYLIFSDDDVVPLDKYVFNTEAHPFLIHKD